MRDRGFSILELLVGVTLAGLIVAMGLLQASRATDTAQTRGMAQVLAEELRSARRRAIAIQEPVAVAFPSSNGSKAHADGFYVLEGTDRPRVTRGRRLNGDFPQACAFVGTWPVSGFTVSRSPLPVLGNPFDLSSWQVPAPRDYLFVFTPSGHVMTNGLARYDGKYHILVSQGVTYSPVSRPPGSGAFPVSFFAPNRVSDPYTISLTGAGAVTVTPGVPGSSLGGSGGVQTASAPALPPPSAGNSPPVLVAATSDPVPLELPSGVAAVVPASGYLTLDLEVREPDGQVPRCTWRATGGTLSSRLPVPMEWNATARTWKGRWVWSPPDSVAPGDEFVLTYTVDDGHGGVISGRLGTNGKVRVGGEERIAYTAVTPAGIPEIGSVSPDGVGKRLLTPEDDALGAYFPGWQPGGNQLAYVSINEAGASALCVVNRDGTAVKVLDSDTDGAIVMGHWGFPCFPATWSPDGTRLVYCRLEGDTSSLYIVNADGSGKRRLTTPGALRSDSRPSWTREDTIVFERSRLNAAGEAQRVDVARISPSGGPLDILLTAPDVYHSFPQLSLDGSRLLFLKNLTVFSCKLDGTDERQLSSGPMLATKPVFSPNGGLIAYCGYEIISMTDNTMGVYVTTLGGLHPETGNPGAKMIWKENCDTATLMAGFLYSQEPAWSVDSSRLVFRNGSSFWGGGGLMHSRILGAPEPRKVFDTTMLDGMLCPSWAP